ncbi:hypothetical protein DMJ13_03570 [halophilic archaeon]|nr:hypothetical protein DMJ13_03570 [halophilic archaeon]
MPETGDDTQMAAAYPTNDQYERWKEQADEFDMSVSGFIASMVEAGMKKFEASVEPDETNRELREQRDDLKHELDDARERISDLEDRLYRSDSAEIRRFVERNPGASFERITSHLRETVPERANEHLAVMEGESVEVHNDAYYPPAEVMQEEGRR